MTGSGFRLNVPHRMPFNNLNDPRLDFLMNMATMFKRMDNSISGRRIKGLTCQTSNALHQTLVRFIELIKTLLHHGYKYVLPGNYLSDRTEGEFGIYRESSGGNFLVSAEQVFNGLQLQRINLCSKLDVMDGKFDSDCCTADIMDSEVEIELLEKCFEGASSLNSIEKTLYYICGYVARKENIVCCDTATSLHRNLR